MKGYVLHTIPYSMRRRGQREVSHAVSRPLSKQGPVFTQGHLSRLLPPLLLPFFIILPFSLTSLHASRRGNSLSRGLRKKSFACISEIDSPRGEGGLPPQWSCGTRKGRGNPLNKICVKRRRRYYDATLKGMGASALLSFVLHHSSGLSTKVKVPSPLWSTSWQLCMYCT